MTKSGPQPLEPGTVVAERYRIRAVLGQGGMGTVYEATNVVTEKPVALKLLSADVKTPEVRRRLLREAQLAARVQHPNVIDIYDVGFDGESIFLVMELLRGRPLDEWLDERAPVPHSELLALVQPLLRGLAALHAQGIVHRDIKPANVFVLEVEHEPPRAKLLDLGIARDRASHAVTLTDPTQIIGTPAYMAPEQIERPDLVDARTDVYACGVLLYEALAGERPFRAENLTSLIGQILTSDPLPLSKHRPDLPEGLSEVVAHAMRRRAGARFADVGALATALAPFGPADAYVRVERSAPSLPLHRTSYALWIALAVLVVVSVAMLMSLGGTGVTADPASEARRPPPVGPRAPALTPPAEDAPDPTREASGASRVGPRGAPDPIVTGIDPPPADVPAAHEIAAPRRTRRAPRVERPESPPDPRSVPSRAPRPSSSSLHLDPDDF